MNERLVVAIEDGRIVRVSEDYARREGLTILRRPSYAQDKSTSEAEKKKNMQEFRPHILDTLKKPVGWKEKQVLSELVDNFHWLIKTERKKRNLSRSQLAKIIEEPEDVIKILEFGKLPSNDFVILNKVQKTLNINLRKDGRDFSRSIKDMIEENKKTNKSLPAEKDGLLGGDIEIVGED